MSEPRFEIWQGPENGWRWSLVVRREGRELAVGPAQGHLTREEAEAEVTEVAKAAQVAAKAWLVEHPEAAK